MFALDMNENGKQRDCGALHIMKYYLSTEENWKKIIKQINNMRCRIHHLIRDGSIRFQSGTKILSAHCFDSSNKLIHGQEPQTNLKSDRECVGKSISMWKGWKKFPPVRWQREEERVSSAFMTNHKWGFSVIELDLD